jgi:molybdopterin biosynthesis enzyme
LIKNLGLNANFPRFLLELMVKNALDQESLAVYASLMDRRLRNHQKHLLLVVLQHHLRNLLEVGHLLEQEVHVQLLLALSSALVVLPHGCPV